MQYIYTFKYLRSAGVVLKELKLFYFYYIDGWGMLAKHDRLQDSTIGLDVGIVSNP